MAGSPACFKSFYACKPEGGTERKPTLTPILIIYFISLRGLIAGNFQSLFYLKTRYICRDKNAEREENAQEVIVYSRRVMEPYASTRPGNAA